MSSAICMFVWMSASDARFRVSIDQRRVDSSRVSFE
jgi:hypothetical protein